MSSEYLQISNEILRKLSELISEALVSSEENVTKVPNENSGEVNKQKNNIKFEVYLTERKKHLYQINKWIKIIKNQYINTSNKTD